MIWVLYYWSNKAKATIGLVANQRPEAVADALGCHAMSHSSPIDGIERFSQFRYL